MGFHLCHRGFNILSTGFKCDSNKGIFLLAIKRIGIVKEILYWKTLVTREMLFMEDTV